MGHAGLIAKLEKEARESNVDPEEYKHNYFSANGEWWPTREGEWGAYLSSFDVFVAPRPNVMRCPELVHVVS